MAYDAKTRTVVMFGGEGHDDGGGTGNQGIFGDTWVWNGTKATWTQKLPTTSLSVRRTSLTYDPAMGTLVLYGGDTAGGDSPANDTWLGVP